MLVLWLAVVSFGPPGFLSSALTGGATQEEISTRARSLLGAVLDGDEPVHLRVPARAALFVPAAPHEPEPVPEGELRAHAYQYVSRVFSRPTDDPKATGFVRRGRVLHARERVSGKGCKGAWYSLVDGGFVCSGDGFAIARAPRELAHQRQPDVAKAMPYRYAKAASGAPRFYRVPSEAEEAELARALLEDRRLPKVVEGRMQGVYLLALDREQTVEQRQFVRTVRGRYVRASDLEPKPEPGMRGELLGQGETLPYAFVYGSADATVPVYRMQSGHAQPTQVGVADNHARIRVEREERWDGRSFVVSPEGLALERERVRVARRIPPPEGVPAGAKWIHVDLEEQALIAYEGERPVFATLVPSGKGEEFATPTGLFQVREKHLSTTMRGPDPDEGVYEVEEVPWTMFYQDSYALHGAYWHDDFGKTRSHGCTNLAPIDARWLFYWSDRMPPPGWNTLRNFKGTHVYVTGVGD